MADSEYLKRISNMSDIALDGPRLLTTTHDWGGYPDDMDQNSLILSLVSPVETPISIQLDAKDKTQMEGRSPGLDIPLSNLDTLLSTHRHMYIVSHCIASAVGQNGKTIHVSFQGNILNIFHTHDNGIS